MYHTPNCDCSQHLFPLFAGFYRMWMNFNRFCVLLFVCFLLFSSNINTTKQLKYSSFNVINTFEESTHCIQGSTLSFLAGCLKSHFLGWYRNFLVYLYSKLNNQVVNSTCPKDKLGWIWRADDPKCRTLVLIGVYNTGIVPVFDIIPHWSQELIGTYLIFIISI